MAETLHFDAASHTYTLGGRRLPSVTEIGAVLEPDQFQYVDGELLDRAAEFGKHVHLACSLHDEGRLNRKTLDPELVPYLDGWIRFLADTGARVLLCEKSVHHPAGFATTPDRVLRLKADHVTEIKTTSTLPRYVGPQTAAQREAIRHTLGMNTSPVRLCVHLRGDGTYRLHRLTDRADWNHFLSALNVWNWRNA